MPSHYTPDYWRNRAEAARAAAEQFDPRHFKCRRILLDIADGYDELAAAARRPVPQKLESSSPSK